jgi:hypothetical protein
MRIGGFRVKPLYLILGLGGIVVFGALALGVMAWIAFESLTWAVSQVPALKDKIPENWTWAWVTQVPGTLVSESCWQPLKNFLWNSAVLESPPALQELESLARNCIPPLKPSSS